MQWCFAGQHGEKIKGKRKQRTKPIRTERGSLGACSHAGVCAGFSSGK